MASTKKASDKTAPKKASATAKEFTTKTEGTSKKEEKKATVTLFKFKIIGYGSELAWIKLNKVQLKYWREVYKSQIEYSAKKELVDHIRHGNVPQHEEPGYVGEYYNWDDEFEEYPFYKDSCLEIELFGDREGKVFLETIVVPLVDKRLKKSFFDGFVQATNERNMYKTGTLFAKTEDRGEYCIGEMDISEEENDFSLDNFVVSVEKIQGYQYVSMLEYNNLNLDYENANDPDNKDFDAWFIWE
jgi:hypothetical protein